MVNYKRLCAQMKGLTEDVPHEVANLANASALIWQTLPDINWAGFYKMENGRYVLSASERQAELAKLYQHEKGE